jgi:WXG100 family type VII secretion target
MPASKVRADYEALAQIAAEFRRQAAGALRMLVQLRLQKEILQHGAWVGKGAEKFYAEMDSSILPAVQRLVSALEAAGRVTGHIIQVMRDAEAEAARVLQDGLGIDSQQLSNLVETISRGGQAAMAAAMVVADAAVRADSAALGAVAEFTTQGVRVGAVGVKEMLQIGTEVATAAVQRGAEVVTEAVEMEARLISEAVQAAAVASEPAVESAVGLTRGVLDVGASVAAYAIGREMHKTQEEVSFLKSELGTLEQNLKDLMHEMEDAQQHETDMERRVGETDNARDAVLDNLADAADAAGELANAVGGPLGG